MGGFATRCLEPFEPMGGKHTVSDPFAIEDSAERYCPERFRSIPDLCGKPSLSSIKPAGFRKGPDGCMNCGKVLSEF
jgi:hypothetical protein